MWILIKLLHQKPSDLDLQCFQKSINPSSAGQELKLINFHLHANILGQDQTAPTGAV